MYLRIIKQSNAKDHLDYVDKVMPVLLIIIQEIGEEVRNYSNTGNVHVISIYM